MVLSLGAALTDPSALRACFRYEFSDRQDQKILYPIREGIPVMLIEEGIPLEQVT